MTVTPAVLRCGAFRLAATASLLALLLGGCASGNYCLKEQDYQGAPSVPELAVPSGLTLPQAAGTLRVPPAPATSVPFGIKPEKGKAQCLDRPPPMVEPPPAKV